MKGNETDVNLLHDFAKMSAAMPTLKVSWNRTETEI